MFCGPESEAMQRIQKEEEGFGCGHHSELSAGDS